MKMFTIFFVLFLLTASCFVKSDGADKSESFQRKDEITARVSTPEECTRTCVAGEPPRTCYYKFILERYNSLGGACSACIVDEYNTVCENPQCILGDGVERGVFSANRKVPGPEIQVCKSDRVIVDVKNDIYGSGLTIHWHGITQQGSPYSDGVPHLTQCPIENGNTFRYAWNASDAGTYFWHAHTGLHKLNGLYGTLVVREPQEEDVVGDFYDFDLPEHVLLLSDALHEDASEHFPGRLSAPFQGQVPATLLINGKGQYEDIKTGITTSTPLEVFTVKPDTRYRFRLINSMATFCPAILTVEGHKMSAIASDGKSFEPVEVDSIISFSGERYDFIIKTNQDISFYWIQVRGLGACAQIETQQLAILKYVGADFDHPIEKPQYVPGLPVGSVLNPVDSECEENNSNDICLDQLESLESVDQYVLQTEPDVRLYLPFTFLYYTNEELFVENHYNRYLVFETGEHVVSLVNGISFEFPTSPPLSQIDDIPQEQFCNGDSRPENCPKNCSCTHMYDVPLHGIVEIILVDDDPKSTYSHPFHLHGQHFYVLKLGQYPVKYQKGTLTQEIIKSWDQQGLLQRNLQSPIKKDTVAVPSDGYVILRFKADNPGYWLFHCHFTYHTATGMNLVIHVGEQTDIPSVPKNFPKCGDFLPDIEF